MLFSPWPGVRTRCREAPPGWRTARAAAAAEPWSGRGADAAGARPGCALLPSLAVPCAW